MNTSEALDFVETQLAERIGQFRSSRNFFRGGSRKQAMTTTALGALTTFLVAINQIFDSPWIAIPALASAGLATVGSAWTGWYGYKDSWVAANDTLTKLRDLEFKIRYEKAVNGQTLGQDRLDAYVREYQAILTEAHEKWRQLRLAQP
ncbi:SLATT domain-containing protein [Nonomuraea sp. NPDC001831]|uniref:SLATT domain-containing protein n=1 Tax=Nonomuraea sp. NPDC001831 TaxID=3364340 RepID=UPI003694544F